MIFFYEKFNNKKKKEMMYKMGEIQRSSEVQKASISTHRYSPW